jgi:hypothetical protein
MFQESLFALQSAFMSVFYRGRQLWLRVLSLQVSPPQAQRIEIVRGELGEGIRYKALPILIDRPFAVDLESTSTTSELPTTQIPFPLFRRNPKEIVVVVEVPPANAGGKTVLKPRSRREKHSS